MYFVYIYLLTSRGKQASLFSTGWQFFCYILDIQIAQVADIGQEHAISLCVLSSTFLKVILYHAGLVQPSVGVGDQATNWNTIRESPGRRDGRRNMKTINPWTARCVYTVLLYMPDSYWFDYCVQYYISCRQVLVGPQPDCRDRNN